MSFPMISKFSSISVLIFFGDFKYLFEIGSFLRVSIGIMIKIKKIVGLKMNKFLNFMFNNSRVLIKYFPSLKSILLEHIFDF